MGRWSLPSLRSGGQLMLLGLGVLGATPSWAQAVPKRQVPGEVLLELSEVQRRFDSALAADCEGSVCFAKGCAYVDHVVVDRPKTTSMPGLGEAAGPGSVEAQTFLTKATCAFAHEASLGTEPAEALVRRLQLKVSGGFVNVSVSRQELPVLNEEPPAEEPVEELPVVEPPFTLATAARALWEQLLPHAWWMAALGLGTFALLLLMWAWRRLGHASLEEQAMLAQMLREDAAVPPPVDSAPAVNEDAAYVTQQATAWRLRFAASGPEHPDHELEALVRELLVARDLPMLAKATLSFPEAFVDAFPAGGEVASLKLELADYLKVVDLASLPGDAEFYRKLDRQARAASIGAQPDAQLIRSLRDEFGATGLAQLFERIPARAAALLLVMAPAEERADVISLLSPTLSAALAAELLRSNRMHRDEAAYVVDVLQAARLGRALPAAPALPQGEQGVAVDAAGPVSELLGRMPAETRQAVLRAALEQHRGLLPRWQQGLMYADLLWALSSETRADVLLGVNTEALAAWLGEQEAGARAALVEALPRALKVAVQTAPDLPRRQQLVLADQARAQLADGFQRQLIAMGERFERALSGELVGERG